MARSAIVIGGGIAGLSAGIALRKAGYEVTLFEQAPKPEPIGAALSIWGNAMAGLDWLGCGDAVRERAHPVRRLCLTRADDRVLWGPVDISGSDSWLPMRGELQTALLAELGVGNCRLGVHVDHLCERGGKVVALADGEPLAEADLAIAADGIRSPVCSSLIGNPPAFRGYIGVLGVGRNDGEDRVGMAEEIWAERDRFGLFDAGEGRRYWFHMCPAADPDAVAALDHAAVMERARAFPARVGSAVAATEPDSLIALSIAARAVPQRSAADGLSASAMPPTRWSRTRGRADAKASRMPGRSACWRSGCRRRGFCPNSTGFGSGASAARCSIPLSWAAPRTRRPPYSARLPGRPSGCRRKALPAASFSRGSRRRDMADGEPLSGGGLRQPE